jgi:hypothetical protein
LKGKKNQEIRARWIWLLTPVISALWRLRKPPHDRRPAWAAERTCLTKRKEREERKGMNKGGGKRGRRGKPHWVVDF